MTTSTTTTPAFAIIEIGVQTLILGLTFSKQFLAIQHAWMRSPITSLIYRDGMISYFAILVVLIGVLLNGESKHLKDSTHMIFPIFIALLSSVACRVITNMLRLAKSNFPQCENTFSGAAGEITTILDTIFTVEPDQAHSQDEES